MGHDALGTMLLDWNSAFYVSKQTGYPFPFEYPERILFDLIISAFMGIVAECILSLAVHCLVCKRQEAVGSKRTRSIFHCVLIQRRRILIMIVLG